MESSSQISLVLFIVFTMVFTAAAIAEAKIVSLRREPLQAILSQESHTSVTLTKLSSLPMGPTGAMILLKVLCFSSALVSASAFVILEIGIRWPLITLALLLAFVLLGSIDSVARSLSARQGRPISDNIAMSISLISWILSPVLILQEALMSKVGTRTQMPTEPSTSNGLVSDNDKPADVDDDILDEREVRMIRGVVRQDKTTAREIMVPRVDVVAVDIHTSMSELAELMVLKSHSRIPVYRGDIDSIEGIAYARDILRHMVQEGKTSTQTIQDFIRKALFIPESKTLEELLNEFQETQVHIAIVIDEYGGVSGVVTIEDLLEEIVGEIRDEFDTDGKEPGIVSISSNVFMIDAGVSIDQLKDLWGVSLEGEGYDTLGGFVYQKLGRIPSAGDSVEHDDLRIEIVSTTGRRLKRLRVTREQ